MAEVMGESLYKLVNAMAGNEITDEDINNAVAGKTFGDVADELTADIKDGTILVGSKVVANPALTGTEADLTSLEVNGEKYKISMPTDAFIVTVTGQLNSSFQIESITADKTFAELQNARTSGKRILVTFQERTPFVSTSSIVFSEIPFIFNINGACYTVTIAREYTDSINNISYPMIGILSVNGLDLWTYTETGIDIPNEINVNIDFSDTRFTPYSISFPNNYIPHAEDILNIVCRYYSGGTLNEYETISAKTKMSYTSMLDKFAFSVPVIVSNGSEATMLTINADNYSNSWSFTVSNKVQSVHVFIDSTGSGSAINGLLPATIKSYLQTGMSIHYVVDNGTDTIVYVAKKLTDEGSNRWGLFFDGYSDTLYLETMDGGTTWGLGH